MIARAGTFGVGRILQQSRKRFRPKAVPRANSGIVARPSRHPVLHRSTRCFGCGESRQADRAPRWTQRINKPPSPQGCAWCPEHRRSLSTGRFHAKIFIFDDDLLVGSSNLTQGGLFRNRRATVRFCALELYGTIRPTECPPINGRMAKALRYLGLDVRGA